MEHSVTLSPEQLAQRKARKHSETFTHNTTSEKPTQSTETNNDAASSLHGAFTNLHIPADHFVIKVDDKPPILIVESEAAKRLAGFMVGRFALNGEAGFWHRFAGTHWEPVHQSIVDETITVAMFTACGSVGFKSRYLNDVATIIKRGNLLPMPPFMPGRLPFQNGLLDLLTRDLTPITASNADSWCIPHHYRNDSACPVFMDWLSQATGGDDGKQIMLRAFIAAALTGRADLQKFIFMRGPGGTGKSTYMRLLEQILGRDNCQSTDLKNLETNRFETARLYGKRLVVVTDTDKFGGSVNVLKALTGQDPIRNERKHVQNGGTFIFAGMVLMAGNETLQTTDYTSGLARRMLVIEFDHVISPQAKREFINAGGEDRLHREIPGIINWALELDRDQVAAVFMHPPDSVRQSTFDAATDQNPLVGWITASLYPKRDSKVYVGDRQEGKTKEGMTFYVGQDYKLFPNYLLWCKHSGREAVSMQRFSRLALDVLKNTLQVEVIKHRDGSGVYIQGVAIDQEKAAEHWGDA